MLTKKEFESFRMEAEKALSDIAKKYNVDIKAGKIKYTNNSFNLDLQINKKEIDGKSFEQVEFEKYCSLYGFRPEDYNKTFTMQGKQFSICGFKPRASKMPVLAKSNDGKIYKFGQEIKRLITQ